MTRPQLRLLSLGAGIQSTAVLLLTYHDVLSSPQEPSPSPRRPTQFGASVVPQPALLCQA
ncbi:MAG: hypothetical protein ACRDQ4_17265 [Pseudonocardiaceae bacterium]